ncbi:MAG: histidine kinase, partial [Anaerolinea sp.]|nr:histidine kinase [Anaerolinea sp.]
RGKAVCQRKDGSQYTLQYNIAPIVDEQGNINYVSVISDVSQSELLEQQNRQAQKLEAIGSLAAGVAHEINTPTQYVGNNLLFIKKEFDSIIQLLGKNQQLLNQAQTDVSVVKLIEELHQEEIDADLSYLTAEIPRAIDESLEGIARVTKIVQAIKEFSHPSMDEKTPVDLNRAIDTTITVSRNEWKYVADLVPHYDEKLPTVICSPGEINQVILNLITNAAHAIKEQIEKGVYTKGLIEIFTFAKEKYVEIHVKDNGGGIPAEYREKVFNPFFTTKPVGMGTGQGLSISYKVIVNKHNGVLVFDTDLGKGTTFKITLPLAGGD